METEREREEACALLGPSMPYSGCLLMKENEADNRETGVIEWSLLFARRRRYLDRLPWSAKTEGDDSIPGGGDSEW